MTVAGAGCRCWLPVAAAGYRLLVPFAGAGCRLPIVKKMYYGLWRCTLKRILKRLNPSHIKAGPRVNCADADVEFHRCLRCRQVGGQHHRTCNLLQRWSWQRGGCFSLRSLHRHAREEVNFSKFHLQLQELKSRRKSHIFAKCCEHSQAIVDAFCARQVSNHFTFYQPPRIACKQLLHKFGLSSNKTFHTHKVSLKKQHSQENTDRTREHKQNPPQISCTCR